MDENRPIRLLSLDGGGIRGVSSILVLKEVMRQVNIDRKPEDHLQPWQVFDLIGGTSTGGIIALMLGCLRMSVDECHDVYMKLSKTIFLPKRWKCNVFSRSIDLISANERYDSAKMEELVKQIIKERTGSRNTMLQDSLQGSPYDEELLLLRSYVNKQQPDVHSAKFEMWEALRATSAASTYFKEYRRGNEGYVDGAFKSNNPIFEVHHEATDLWPGRDMFLVSIGTGTKPSTPLGGHVVKLVRSMTKLATATEGSWIRFHRTHKQLAEDHRLFRFSAPGIGEVDLGNYKMIGNVAMRTETYLRDTTTARDIARCSKEMLAIQTHEYTTVHKLKDSERDCLKLLSSAGGAYESQRLSIETPVQGTCHWFLNHKTFTSWLRDTSSALLWVTANPGCGKTVLSRFLVDILSRQASEATVCYFFFKAGEEGRHHSHQALCAILHQVFKEHAKALNFAMKEFSSSDSKNFTQNIEKLWDILCETSDSLSNRQIIVIIDALDECSEVTRNRFIDLLVSTFPQMIGSRKLLGRLKIIVTSRPWPSIETRFRYLSCVRLRGENETSSLSRDIEMMVQAKVGKLRVEGTITPEACSILETTLAQGADRTFLWASLVLETISKLPSRKLSAVKSTLEDTPADLDQLYETALLDVEDHVAVTRMLQIVLAATRPLTLDEINMAMCISSTHRTVQDLLQDLEPDMEYTVKQLGGFFLRIINSTVHLVHQTARDFLLVTTSMKSTAWMHSLKLSDCHSTMALATIQYLLLDGWPARQKIPANGGEVDESDIQLLKSFPTVTVSFYKYAARHWAIHTDRQSDNQEVDASMSKQISSLCDMSGSSFHNWWYLMTGRRYFIGLGLSEGLIHESSPLGRYPLHFAADYGYWPMMKGLIDSKSCSITSLTHKGVDFLYVASRGHNVSNVRWILRNFDPSCLQVGMALQAAASLEIVKALVETGVDLGQRYLCPTNGEMDLTSVLFSALRWGGLPKLEYLVNMGAGCLKETILGAALEGQVDYLKVLLAAPDERSSEERFLDLQAVLKAATERGAVYARRFLMDFGVQEPEGTDISAGLAFAVMHGCNAEDVLALFEDGARDINGAALLSRAAFGEMGGIQTLFSVFEYPVEILNAALATFFTTNLDNETKNFLLKTIERSLSSSSHNRRVSNGFTIQPLIGQNYETNVIFLTTLSGKGARMPPAMFHQVLCWTIAMDEQLAAFLLQNRRSLQDDGDMFGACEYLALACLWGRPTIIRHLSGRDTGQDVTGISYDLLFRAVTVSGNAEALDALLDNRCIDSGKGAADKFAGKEFLDQWAVVEKVLGLKDSTASPLDLAARLGYQDVMAKLLSAKMVVRSRTAE
ncbi:Vegetative incompatibility protein HET-E-1 [Colletotrichum siamense]|uniref:Vegetative incompatibility protein HET-E-1 n=1 Tax=Colletotrichum siamense TaxID=690259 RepID=UPI0018727005|nr:Vegetative incompatibility protein HET-E-1 [Colletotrichum siamense]KAF5497972.1 Vegetative incompatibility protein HET-E-1 [Colletotrichum siamense]